MQSQNKTFGLIGYPLGHSYSKGHFSRKFELEGLVNHSYENFEIPSIGLIKKIVRETTDLVGLNVTIPYKQTVMSYLDEIDPVAVKIGAVNTIKITRTSSRCILSGYNTDVIGFTKSVTRWPINNSIKALVFGSGGSSLAIRYALGQLDIEFTTVSRKKEEGFIPYEALTEEMVIDHLLWVNCTPVGMFPDVHEMLSLPYQYLTPGHYLFDLVYNPEITGFLSKGIEAGSRLMNGSTMLYEQAEASWEIWMKQPV
ncbi:MAG: shikimate dehydrogenase [Porphyromonadaceae bacterium]|nr:MAG: shikimate dehydrogenase [Porphyromonadaceae bacterium]